MIIRRSTLQDEPDLARMGEAFWSETPLSAVSQFNPEALIQFIRASTLEPNVAFWVAEDEDGICGAVGGILYPLYFSGDLVAQELFWWVDPDKRKTKAGRGLYDALETWARENGAKALSMIAIENGKAESVGNIYKRMGYMATEHAYIRGL